MCRAASPSPAGSSFEEKLRQGEDWRLKKKRKKGRGKDQGMRKEEHGRGVAAQRVGVKMRSREAVTV